MDHYKTIFYPDQRDYCTANSLDRDHKVRRVLIGQSQVIEG